MREILFRGKRLSDGGWSYGNLRIANTGVTIIVPNDTPLGKYGKVDPETVCQFTGLTDKNGNKIWENDVCQYIDSDGYETEFVVKYGRHEGQHGINLGFYIEWSEMDGYREDICFWAEERDIEVIGNIFDNHKLAEEVRPKKLDQPKEERKEE